jgi:hypothetical protein
MNKFLTPLLLVAVVALSGVVFAQRGKLQRQQAELAALREAVARESATQQAEVAQIQERSEVFKRESEQLRQKLAERTAPTDNAKTVDAASAKKEGMGDFMKGVAKMFTDPEMKKVMRSQQGMAIRMMYGDLTSELGLTPDEATLIFDLLTERQMSLAGKAMAAGTDEAGADAAAAEAKNAQDSFAAELKNILGEDRMKKFEAYERTVGERMTLQQYTQSMSAAGSPLDETQRKSLLSIMTEERLKQPPSKFDPGTKDVAGAMKAMRTGEGMEQAMEQQRALNQRVLARARTVLSADQTLAFEAAQKQMIDMQEMGMKMWKSGMGGSQAPK